MKSASVLNLIITATSKILIFLFGIYIAKYLSESAYGEYVKIGLITSLLPIMHLGLMNGAAIVLPRHSHPEGTGEKSHRKEVFHDYNTASLVIQAVSALGLYFFGFGAVSIWGLNWLVGNLILMKVIESARVYLGANLDFSSQIRIRFLDEIFKPAVIFAAFFVHRNLDALFFAQFVSSLVICGYLFFAHRSAVAFGKSPRFFDNLKSIIHTGFFVFIVWAFDLALRSVDKWFVSGFFDNEQLASYGFATNMAFNLWLLGLSFLGPYSQQLFSLVAKNDFKAVNELMGRSTKRIGQVLLICGLGAVLVYPVITAKVIGKYGESYPVFIAALFAAGILSLGNMCIYYLTSTNNFRVLYRAQIFAMGLVLVFDVVIIGANLSTVYFAFSSLVGMVSYIFLISRIVRRDLSLKLAI